MAETFEVANANFGGANPGTTRNFGSSLDQLAMPRCLHAWEAVTTANCGARWDEIWMYQGLTDPGGCVESHHLNSQG